MTNPDIAHRRLYNLHISDPRFEKPEDVVGWLGAVQSQDYAGAKWALGLRMQNATDDMIDQALADGSILRTHVLRPTWHFVTPEDIRWMLELTAPRVCMALATYDRQLGLDDDAYARSSAIMAQALKGGNFLTRPELMAALQKAGFETEGTQRSAHFMMHAELAGVVCSGPRQGKQFTYALLDERAPHVKPKSHDEALAELARRYFASRGPATLKDYVWWSGLTAADAKHGIALNGSRLAQEVIDGVTYWHDGAAPAARQHVSKVYLLPPFDEAIVGYTDRSAVVDGPQVDHLDPRNNIMGNYTIVMDSRIVSIWKRTLKRGAVVVETRFAASPTAADERAFADALQRYGAFLGLPVTLDGQGT